MLAFLFKSKSANHKVYHGIPPPALCAAHTGYIIQASDWLKANLTIKSGLPLINLKLK